MSKAENQTQKIQKTLESLSTCTPDILGAAVVSEDGHLIARDPQTQAEESSVGTMASVLLRLGASASGKLSLGGFKQVMINGENGNVLMVEAGDGALLMVLLQRRATLGLVFLDVSRASRSIADLLQPSVLHA